MKNISKSLVGKSSHLDLLKNKVLEGGFYNNTFANFIKCKYCGESNTTLYKDKNGNYICKECKDMN